VGARGSGGRRSGELHDAIEFAATVARLDLRELLAAAHRAIPPPDRLTRRLCLALATAGD